MIGINSIKEENGEESMTYHEHPEKINYEECNLQKNNLGKNKSNEEGDHSINVA